MTILNHWKIDLSVDEVLRAQASDPDIVKSRRPSLVDSINEGIGLGAQLIKPQVLFEKYPVAKFVHQRLEMVTDAFNNSRAFLSGQLIADHLAHSQEIIVMVCTIGSELDEMVSSLFRTNPVLAVALDGYGSAAVEKLSLIACNYFEDIAKKEGLYTTMPLNPGMIGWPLDIGQPEIFVLLDSEDINVSLTDSCMMKPNKSLSMVIGISKMKSLMGNSCDYCSLKGVCRYQDHYAK